MKMKKALLATWIAALLIAAGGCRVTAVNENAADGALAILDRLDKLGGNRTIALEGDIRGYINPPCSMMEAFLEAKKKRPDSTIKLVERDLLPLIQNEQKTARGDAFEAESRVRLGQLLSADTVVIAWGNDCKAQIFKEDGQTGARQVKEEFWFTSYLHLVAIDIETGCVIASWSYYPETPRSVAKKVSSWIRDNDTVVVQPSLDDEVKSALLTGLHKGSGGRYSVAVRDLLNLLARESKRQSSDFFDPSNRKRLQLSGATAIIGADSAMGFNLRSIDVLTGEIIGGLPGPLDDHLSTSYEEPRKILRL